MRKFWWVVTTLFMLLITLSCCHVVDLSGSKCRQNHDQDLIQISRRIWVCEIAYQDEYGSYTSKPLDIALSPDFLEDKKFNNFTFYFTKQDYFDLGNVHIELPEGHVPYVGVDKFKIIIAGNLDDDPYLDIYELSDDKGLIHLADDLCDKEVYTFIDIMKE